MGTNRIQERSDQFWNGYSKILIRFTVWILSASLVVTVGLTVCFFYFVQIRQFDQTDFIVRNGNAQKNAQRINEIFGNDKDFRAHQQMDLYPALDIIIKRKVSNNSTDMNETNMLNKDIIEEVRTRISKSEEHISIPVRYHINLLLSSPKRTNVGRCQHSLFSRHAVINDFLDLRVFETRWIK